MKTVKEIINRIVMEQLPWIMGIAGIPLLIYGAYFQTVGFSYISISDLGSPVLLSGAVGYVLMRSAGRARMNEKQYFRMLLGYEFLFSVSFIALYCTPSITLFYISICVLAYTTMSIIMSLFDMSRKKREQEALEGTQKQ